MPTYVFEAMNSAGKPQKGTIEAVSSEEAIQRIKSQGFFPTSVREQKAKCRLSCPRAEALAEQSNATISVKRKNLIGRLCRGLNRRTSN